MNLSVVLCTYNGEQFLSEQLDSILFQSITVNEIIICDDLSSDKTIEIIKEYMAKFPSIIRLFVNNKSLGTIRNFEKAIKLATGDLIFLADQDDIWCLNKVQTICDFFKNHKECKLLFSDGDLIDGDGIKLNSTLWEKWGFDSEKRLSWKNNQLAFGDLVQGINKITGATVCFSKTLKAKIIPINLPLNYWHDGWIGLHAAAINGLFFIEESLIQYRVHDNQQIGISSNVLHETTFKANEIFISRDKYYNRLRTMYPNLKEYIPYKKKNLLERLFFKTKNYFINGK